MKKQATVKISGGGSFSCLARSAFSLAEILITLGIIGVVAALTIPNLITSHQKESLLLNFKRQYLY